MYSAPLNAARVASQSPSARMGAVVADIKSHRSHCFRPTGLAHRFPSTMRVTTYLLMWSVAVVVGCQGGRAAAPGEDDAVSVDIDQPDGIQFDTSPPSDTVGADADDASPADTDASVGTDTDASAGVDTDASAGVDTTRDVADEDVELADTSTDADAVARDTDPLDTDANFDSSSDVDPECETGTCEAPCDPGSLRCNEALVEFCGSDGSWLSGQDCSETERICVDGSCAERVCSPGTAPVCRDGDSFLCREDGSGWNLVESCGDAGCADGSCLGICGDGRASFFESCDGLDVHGLSCAEFPDYASGELGCDDSCRLDFGSCTVRSRVAGTISDSIASPPSTVLSHGFGRAIASDGRLVAIGAPFESDRAGAVYVYELVGGDFVSQGKVTVERGEDDDLFGWSVDIDGDVLVVGAYGERAAYVFMPTEGVWTQTARLAPDEDDSDYARSVATDGELVLVGDGGDDNRGSDAGAVHLYGHSGDGAFVHEGSLYATDASGDAQFGSSLALLDDVLLIGAYSDGALGDGLGAAYLFERSEDTWSERSKLVPSEPLNVKFFGYGAALSERHAVIGSINSPTNGHHNAGAGHVVSLSGARPAADETLTATVPAESAQFGTSVAAVGRTAVFGAPGERAGKGAAYIFVEDVAGWRLVRRVVSADSSDGNRFASAVAFVGDILLVGSPGERLVYVVR